ncbi:MAG TPA: hypothetical protein VGC04_11565 [Cellulomonas sp.]
MAELLLLEGEDLPELMARVRDELGPRATIVRAERVRRGGLGGFFAREHYELTVEVAEPPRPAPRPAAPMVLPSGADVLEAMLDAADRAEAGGAELASSLSSLPSVPSVPSVSPSPPAPPAPPVSTAGARFAQVLQGVRALAGEQEAGTPSPAVPAAAGSAARAVPASVGAPGIPVAGARSTAAAAQASPLAAPSPAAPAGAPRAVVVRAPWPAVEGVHVPSWGQSAVGLLAAGVPSEMLDQAGSVAEVLERIPEPPQAPRRPGQVLVVVGPREAASTVAALLRLQWQLPAEAVVESGPEGLTSSAAIVRWRMRTSLAPHPWILVVGVADDATARVLATGLVAAAQPDQVWAVVDARTKRDDAARWLEQIGGARRPDALAVQGLLDTSDPGTVLGLGLPVAWADGMPASRVLWATVLGQGIDVALGRRR